MIELRKGIALVTRPTRLKGLLGRWATRGQALFAMKQAKVQERARRGKIDEAVAALANEDEDFAELEDEDRTYQDVVQRLQGQFDFGLPIHSVDRGFVPTFDFSRCAVVVVVGQDGLVANVAKYVGDLPIVAVNPDPARIDGVLLPFGLSNARTAVSRVLKGQFAVKPVTLARAVLQDGQQMLAFNDFFVGVNTHVSARYQLQAGGHQEVQSSSGVIVSTGAGSTGWMSSIMNMASGIAQWMGTTIPPGRPTLLPWDARQLLWAVREPFVSRTSQANLVAGMLTQGEELVLESLMSAGGVIFSDGVEADYLSFTSGAIARIGVADQQAQLVVP